MDVSRQLKTAGEAIDMFSCSAVHLENPSRLSGCVWGRGRSISGSLAYSLHHSYSARPTMQHHRTQPEPQLLAQKDPKAAPRYGSLLLYH